MKHLTETRICKRCEEEFESDFKRGTWQAYCPTCRSYRDHRPSHVIERKVVAGPFRCVIESLPGRLIEFKARKSDGHASWRLTVKGAEFGAAWEGRIDIFATRDFRPGQVVEVTEVEVTHDVKIVEVTRQTSPFTQLRGGPNEVTHRERLPIDFKTPSAEIVTETRRYIRIDAAQATDEEAATLPRLVWKEAAWKTTLKGFGRQYRYEFDGAPIAMWSVRGSARTGRFGCAAALAIVDDQHPLDVVEKFNFSGGKPGRESYTVTEVV